MPLYVTPSGQWSTSRATAGPDAAEIDLAFPANKADVVALLNRLAAKPPRVPTRLPVDPEADRWRVYCRGQFVGSTLAQDATEACGNIAAELVARPSG